MLQEQKQVERREAIETGLMLLVTVAIGLGVMWLTIHLFCVGIVAMSG
jgi:hypothetical protein